MKILTIVGTRPELIKMARVIALFQEHTEHLLVHTGQNYDYELNQVFFDNLNIPEPDYYLGCANGGSAMSTIGKILSEVDLVLEKEKPDAMLVYGDTNSGLAVIAAKRRKIPIFHMEAGNRCFDMRVPEEINRRIIDHTSDFNFVLTQRAREYLLAEGIRGDRVIVSGSHMQEVLDYHKADIEKSNILETLGFEPGKFFLISIHREENIDRPERARQLHDLVAKLKAEFDLPVIVSTHPRTKKRLSDLGLDLSSEFHAPFGFFDYVKLQQTAKCVISDSGTISEESALLGFPAVTIRDAHERPEINDAGGIIMVPMGEEGILEAIRTVVSVNDSQDYPVHVPDYLGGQVSRKILYTVLSYIHYVNREVWRK